MQSKAVKALYFVSFVVHLSLVPQIVVVSLYKLVCVVSMSSSMLDILLVRLYLRYLRKL